MSVSKKVLNDTFVCKIPFSDEFCFHLDGFVTRQKIGDESTVNSEPSSRNVHITSYLSEDIAQEKKVPIYGVACHNIHEKL